MTDEIDKKNARIQKIKKYGIIVSGIFIVYLVLGFWVVAPLLKPKVEEQLANLLGRKVSIEELKLNPLFLTSTTSNLTIYEADGEPFAGFEELFVNVQLSSIIKWAITVKEVRLQKPFGVLKILPGNKLNIEDILAKLSEPTEEPEAPEETGELPRAVIERLEVVDGRATIENLLGKEPISEVFSPITFELNNLSTLKGREGEFQFVGIGPLGGKFELNGKMTVDPPVVQGNFATKETKLNPIWEHIKEIVSFHILSGSIDTSGDYAVAIVDGQLEAKLENGTFDLTDFELVEKGEEELLITLPSLSVGGARADLNSREIVVDRIRTTDAAIKSWFSADGSSELQRLFQPDIEKIMEMMPPSDSGVDIEPSPPWHATINAMEVFNWKLILDNVTGQNPIRETFTLNSFSVENVSTKKDQQGKYAFVGTGPSGGRYQLDGKMTIDPIKLQGVYDVSDVDLSHFWEHVKDYVSFKIEKGTAGASGGYTLALNDGRIEAKLEKNQYALRQFELVEKGKKDVLISIPASTVKGVGADLQTRNIAVERIQTTDGRIKSWLAKDGTIGLVDLLLTDLQKLQEKQAPEKSESEPVATEPWVVNLKKMAVAGWELDFEDQTLAKPVKLLVNDINVVVEDFSTMKDSQAKVNANMQINRAGDVKINGAAGIDPILADMKVSTRKIAFKPFQPYVNDAVNAQIVKGSTSSNGRVEYRGKNAQPQIRYAGDVSVDGVLIEDEGKTKDFITLAQFKASEIALDLVPNKLRVSDVLVDQPHARVTIDENGMVNVINAFAPAKNEDAKGGESEEQNLLQRLVSFLILQFKGPMPIKVDRVQLNTFTGNFVDGSISPSYSTHVEIKEGKIKGLSSDPDSRADFMIVGSIDQTASLKSTGQMNPMNALSYSRVNLQLKDFQLKTVSPYSGKFIGFKIDEGSLNTELKYMVDDDNVKGDNIIIIDQLKLGERVDSPDALNLPIKLGVAILKDGNGRISVQMPVGGNVKDPKFDFGDAITSALTGTISRAGDEPFSAIAEIDGFTGEELRTIAYTFGDAELNEREIKKLNAIVKFLKEREGLMLDIMGTADRNGDGKAIAGELAGEKSEEDASPSSETSLKTQEASADVQVVVNGEQLEQLAQSRAEKVRIYLVEQGKIEAGRIRNRLVQVKPLSDAQQGFVELFLAAE